MDVIGIGTQVMECARVRKLIDQHADAVLRQVYTERETQYCNGKKHSTEQFTAIWAAKEAVFRCLGTTWKKGTNWTDVEVVCENAEFPPRVHLSGPTRELMAARGATLIMLTMAHTREYATATALALKQTGGRISEDTALDD